MIKVCSLDFLNKSTFDVDIFTADNKILFPKGTKITPELLMNLYFKEMYVSEDAFKKESVKEPPKAQVQETTQVKIEIQTEAQTQSMPEFAVQQKPVEPSIDKNLNEPLEFDEQQAQRVAEYTVSFAKKLGFDQKQTEELRNAAYYHNIGRTKLTNADLNKTGFKKKQAETGYRLLKEEMSFSEKMAEAARFYNKSYTHTKLTSSKMSPHELPYSHIIAITSYYNESITRKVSKEETLKKMLQMGANKFNVFILHKFISMMRFADE